MRKLFGMRQYILRTCDVVACTVHGRNADPYLNLKCVSGWDITDMALNQGYSKCSAVSNANRRQKSQHLSAYVLEMISSLKYVKNENAFPIQATNTKKGIWNI